MQLSLDDELDDPGRHQGKRTNGPVDHLAELLIQEPTRPLLPNEWWSVHSLGWMCEMEETLNGLHALRIIDTVEEADIDWTLVCKPEDRRVEEMMRLRVGTAIHALVQSELLWDRLLGRWKCLSCGHTHGTHTHPIPRPESCDGWVVEEEGKPPVSCNDVYQGRLDKYEIRFDYREIEVQIPELRLRGHPDTLFWRWAEPIHEIRRQCEGQSVKDLRAKIAVAELKSCGEAQFSKKSPWRPAYKEGPSYEHEAQVRVYGEALGVEEMWVVYYNVSDRSGERTPMGDLTAWVQHRLTPDAKKSAGYADKIRRMRSAMEARTTEGRDLKRKCPSKDHWRARRCPRRNECWDKHFTSFLGMEEIVEV